VNSPDEHPVLEARGICKVFRIGHGRPDVLALQDVSLSIRGSEIYGLVGESGSGKSTLSRILIGIERPSTGQVLLDGQPVVGRAGWFNLRRQVQYVFQDPFGSLPANMTVRAIIEDPLRIHRLGSPEERRSAVSDLAERVGLRQVELNYYPAVFSGGQRQRISLARALIMHPRIVICDEIVSGLDVSIQAQILNLLLDLHADLGVTYLFVSHDLRVVRYLCDRVGVMREGELVEENAAESIFSSPSHIYTQELISKVPDFDRPP
jgi:ABC-type glutathione transport system ATPase component